MSKFSVPKPCHENWENMLPEEKGKFCGSCKKTVYDFTQASDEKIQQIFEKEKGNICGRFENTQLIHFSNIRKVVMRFDEVAKKHFSKFGILISAISLLMSISGCQKKMETENVHNNVSDSSKVVNYSVDTLESVISGTPQSDVRIPNSENNTNKSFPLGIIEYKTCEDLG